MIVHSRTTEIFLSKIKKEVTGIITREMGLRLGRTRFLFNGYWTPFHLVCFEGRPLGYYDHRFYEIGINKSLCYSAVTEVLRDLLRHELAHMVTYLTHGRSVDDHGPEFRQACRDYGWGEEVWSSRVEMGQANRLSSESPAEEKLIARVKKLLALARSDNTHEAQAATLKANQILVQHHLSSLGDALDDDHGEEFCVRRLLQGKRATAKFQAICDILRSFYVYPVLNHGGGQVTLEVTGSRENVLIAEYVAEFLDRELEQLYQSNPLRGARQKKSFMRGLAIGYKDKQHKYRGHLAPSAQKALVAVEDHLQKRVRKIYSHLRTNSVTQELDLAALERGRELGENLSIHKGVSSSSDTRFSLIEH